MTDKTSGWIQELLDNPEELNPELAACLVHYDATGMAIKHRLVNEVFYNPMMNPRHNAALRMKKKMLADAKAKREWERYLAIIERPWRAETLVEVADQMTDAEYWDSVAFVWCDTENLWEWDHLVEDLLLSKRPERENLMNEDEHAYLTALPEWVTVFRGHNYINQLGWSWTTSPERAIWFARRFNALKEGSLVSMATVSKESILAVFLWEHEVVLQPDYIDIEAEAEINANEPLCKCGTPIALVREHHESFHAQQAIEIPLSDN